MAIATASECRSHNTHRIVALYKHGSRKYILYHHTSHRVPYQAKQGLQTLKVVVSSLSPFVPLGGQRG